MVAKCFGPERLSAEAGRLLDAQHELAVPDLMWAEIGNVLWKNCRAGQLTEREAARSIRVLDDLPVTALHSRLFSRVRSNGAGHSVYDGVYLALRSPWAVAWSPPTNASSSDPLGRHVLWVGTPGPFN